MKVGDHDEADHRSRDDVHQRQGRDGRQHQQEYDGSDASIADTGARYLFLQGALTECRAAHFGLDPACRRTPALEMRCQVASANPCRRPSGNRK